jgi:hypothetical protein
MKNAFVMMLAIACCAAMGAGTHHVRGYTKKDGTYVASHTAKNPTRKGTPVYTPAESASAPITAKNIEPDQKKGELLKSAQDEKTDDRQ